MRAPSTTPPERTRGVAALVALIAFGVGIAHAEEPGSPSGGASVRTSSTSDSPASSCTPSPRPAELDLRKASRIYASRCALCHGPEGAGDGPVTRYIRPGPRSFADVNFRVRNTPAGRRSTDEEIYCGITRGVPGTSMVGWGMLSGDDRWALVGYLRRFAPPPSAGMEAASNPSEGAARTAALLARGVVIYAGLDCRRCHPDGPGLGPIAVERRSGDARVLDHPFDLARTWTRELARDVVALHDSFERSLESSAMSDEDLWALTYLVQALWRDPSAEPPAGAAPR